MTQATQLDGSEVIVFAGSGSRGLTEAICRVLGVPLGRSELLRFADGNLFVRVQENVRGREIYIVQSTGRRSNDHFMELLFWIDALKRASAASVTAVVPYFSYAKGDKKDEPRVSIRGRVCADAMEAAGVDRVVTMDLHAPQVQGFFRRPVDDLYALPLLCETIRRMTAGQPAVIVSPDAGFAGKATRFARYLGMPLAIFDKERLGHAGAMRVELVSGGVDGRIAWIVDDMIVSGTTLVSVAEALRAAGAKEVYAVATHMLADDAAVERLARSPIAQLIVTDTVEDGLGASSDKLRVVSVAPLLAEAIRRIHGRESISVLFAEAAGSSSGAET